MTHRGLPLMLGAAGIVVLLSCGKSTPTPGPTPAPASTASPAATPGGAGRAGGPGGGAARVPLSRDSLATLRTAYVTQVLQQIAGHENEPAEQVFKNVQVLKGITAAALLKRMEDYGVALSWNCTNCHRLAPQGNWASDTSTDKRRARFMQQMTNDINQSQLPKLYPTNTPRIDCVTCHRGYNDPRGSVLIPERGKPGGPPMPAARPPGGE